MPQLIANGVRIDDTFAEAFGMRATAIVITAESARWARQAADTMTGFATSVIGCRCEAGIDQELAASETPDRRPGVRVLLFGVSTAELQQQLQARVAQCVLTSPGSACTNRLRPPPAALTHPDPSTGPSNSASAMCWRLCMRDAAGSQPPNGSSSCSAASAWNH